MDNPETFMGNIEQEWTIQRHSWVTLSIKQRTKIQKKQQKKQKKTNTTQKTKKMSNTDSNKIPGVNTVLVQEG
jgi:hypothetical protein